jgi:hypothetical protein
MHDAELHLRLWVHCFDGFGKAFQAIYARDEDVLDSTILDLRDDLHPKLRTFTLGHVYV